MLGKRGMGEGKGPGGKDAGGTDKLTSETGEAREAQSAGGSSALERYMREVKKFPLLSREEEHELAVEYKKTGDARLAHKLVNANLRLVAKIAFELSIHPSRMLDLIQEGNVGLMHAVEKFDPNRGVKLATYALWWIRAYMLKYIRDNYRLVKFATTAEERKVFDSIRAAARRAQSRLGRPPSNAEIADELGVDEEVIERMRPLLAAPEISLDAPARKAGGGTAIVETLASDAESPEEIAEREELTAIVRQVFKDIYPELNPKQQIVLERRISQHKPALLEELGKDLGVTHERIRQIAQEVGDRLKTKLKQRFKRDDVI